MVTNRPTHPEKEISVMKSLRSSDTFSKEVENAVISICEERLMNPYRRHHLSAVSIHHWCFKSLYHAFMHIRAEANDLQGRIRITYTCWYRERAWLIKWRRFFSSIGSQPEVRNFGTADVLGTKVMV